MSAAPGLDGWRTAELQQFSLAELEPVAKFFAHIEDSDQPLPQSLVCAKQVILNKPGPATPLNKRLITILPALLLAYTGSRFAQLQEWQNSVMPQGVLGGIRNRHMSTLFNEMRIDLDAAFIDHTPLIGLKLDKAKAFDRIVPEFAAALFLAFGLPKGLVNFFLKIYKGLHRHLSYRNWCSPHATTPANGVAQGCSLSLLAMNVYNKVWFHLLEHLPDITARAFIDDAYLWCHLSNISSMKAAIELTQLWDKLVGQKLNAGKSSMWGSTVEARKAIKLTFPEFPVFLEIVVLGARMYCSERDCFGFGPKTAQRILTDIENIAALPVTHKTRIHLIGAKVIPQISFGAHISKIPKKDIQSIQNAIAKALWVNRPKWRSKSLLQAVLSQPHRTDPVFANAYNTIFELVRMCHTAPWLISKFARTFNHEAKAKHSLAHNLVYATQTLGLELDGNLCISFEGSKPLCLTQVHPKDIRKALQQITRQACYVATPTNARKDFFKPKGIFDVSQSLRFVHNSTPNTQGAALDVSRFESVSVGCILTNDRMASMGWAESSDCRFCHATKECLPHLLQCEKLHELIGQPVSHEFGPNFFTMGHVHHPSFVGRRRLLHLTANELEISPEFRDGEPRRLWSDGSVVHAERFWLTTATKDRLTIGTWLHTALNCGQLLLHVRMPYNQFRSFLIVSPLLSKLPLFSMGERLMRTGPVKNGGNSCNSLLNCESRFVMFLFAFNGYQLIVLMICQNT